MRPRQALFGCLRRDRAAAEWLGEVRDVGRFRRAGRKPALNQRRVLNASWYVERRIGS